MFELSRFGGLDFHPGLFAIEAIEDADGEREDRSPAETSGGEKERRSPGDDVGHNG